jgi:hypothetical protein
MLQDREFVLSFYTDVISVSKLFLLVVNRKTLTNQNIAPLLRDIISIISAPHNRKHKYFFELSKEYLFFTETRKPGSSKNDIDTQKMSLPIDDMIAQYPLINCTIADIVFEKGVVTFAQLAIELHLIFTQADEDENGDEVITETSLMPLVISYESLLSIKVPGKKFIQLSSPSDIIQSWAATNDMEFPDGTIDGDVISITLNLELDYINEIWKEVAPTISANRRARSSSRWSATELLPLKSFTVALASQAASALTVPYESAAAVVHQSAPQIDIMTRVPQENESVAAPVYDSQRDAVGVHNAAPGAQDDHHRSSPCESVAAAQHISSQKEDGAVAPASHHATPLNALIQTPDDSAVRLPRRAMRRPETPESSSLPSSIALSPLLTTTAASMGSHQKPRYTATRAILEDSSLVRTSTRVTTLKDALECANISTPTDAKRYKVSHSGQSKDEEPSASKIANHKTSDDDDEDDDVPLGKLMGGFVSAESKAPLSSVVFNAGKQGAARDSRSVLEESANVKYDFCDLSLPTEINVMVAVPTTMRNQDNKGKRTGSKRSSGGISNRGSSGNGRGSVNNSSNQSKKKVTIDTTETAEVPTVAEKQDIACVEPPCEPIASHANKRSARDSKSSASPPAACLSVRSVASRRVSDGTSTNGGASRAENQEVSEDSHARYLRRGPSRVRMPTPSLARPSVARPLERSAIMAGSAASVAALVSTDDADATSLRKLLDKGLGEDNLEEFMKSAVRLGKRAKQAKRQREESIVNATTCPGDLVELARCATELLQICAEERDNRRAKYFCFFTKKVSSVIEQCNVLSQQLGAALQTKESLQSELQSMVSTLAADQLRWDMVERDDVEAAVASIHEKLVGKP